MKSQIYKTLFFFICFWLVLIFPITLHAQVNEKANKFRISLGTNVQNYYNNLIITQYIFPRIGVDYQLNEKWSMTVTGSWFRYFHTMKDTIPTPGEVLDKRTLLYNMGVNRHFHSKSKSWSYCVGGGFLVKTGFQMNHAGYYGGFEKVTLYYNYFDLGTYLTGTINYQLFPRLGIHFGMEQNVVLGTLVGITPDLLMDRFVSTYFLQASYRF